MKESADPQPTPAELLLLADLRAVLSERAASGSPPPTELLHENQDDLERVALCAHGLTRLLGAFLQWQTSRRCGLSIDEKDADAIEAVLLHHQELLQGVSDEIQLSLQAAYRLLDVIEKPRKGGQSRRHTDA